MVNVDTSDSGPSQPAEAHRGYDHDSLVVGGRRSGAAIEIGELDDQAVPREVVGERTGDRRRLGVRAGARDEDAFDVIVAVAAIAAIHPRRALTCAVDRAARGVSSAAGAAARARQLATRDEIAAVRDRIHARLELVRAALEAFAAVIVKLEVDDDEQVVHAGEAAADHLDGAAEELEVVESALVELAA